MEGTTNGWMTVKDLENHEGISKIKTMLRTTTEKFIFSNHLNDPNRAKSLELVQRLYMMYTVCFEEASRLLELAGLKEVADVLGRVATGFKFIIDKMSKIYSETEEELRFELLRRPATNANKDSLEEMLKGLSQAAPPQPGSRSPTQKPALAWKKEESNPNGFEFGDKDEERRRQEEEENQVFKKVQRLVERSEAGIPVKTEDLGDARTAFQYCYQTFQRMDETTRQNVAALRLQLRSMENLPNLKGLASENIQSLYTDIKKYLGDDALANLQSTPFSIASSEKHYLESESLLLDTVERKTRNLALRVIEMIRGLHKDTQTQETMTLLTSEAISKLTSNEAGKALAKSDQLKAKVEELEKKLFDSQSLAEHLQRQIAELNHDLERKQMQVMDAFKKSSAAMTGLQTLQDSKQKEGGELKRSSIKKQHHYSVGSLEGYKKAMNEGLHASCEALVQQVYESVEDEETNIQLLRRLKFNLKEASLRFIPEDMKTLIEDEDPFDICKKIDHFAKTYGLVLSPRDRNSKAKLPSPTQSPKSSKRTAKPDHSGPPSKIELVKIPETSEDPAKRAGRADSKPDSKDPTPGFSQHLSKGRKPRVEMHIATNSENQDATSHSSSAYESKKRESISKISLMKKKPDQDYQPDTDKQHSTTKDSLFGFSPPKVARASKVGGPLLFNPGLAEPKEPLPGPKLRRTPDQSRSFDWNKIDDADLRKDVSNLSSWRRPTKTALPRSGCRWAGTGWWW